MTEFYELWVMLQEVHLYAEAWNYIVSNLLGSREYSTSSTYLAQFKGTISTVMKPTVWSNWAPPKCKLFAWLILQYRVWTVVRLQRRGWPNCALCQLCKRKTESAAHIMLKCCYLLRIWNGIIAWLALTHPSIPHGASFTSVKDWWHLIVVHSNWQDQIEGPSHCQDQIEGCQLGLHSSFFMPWEELVFFSF